MRIPERLIPRILGEVAMGAGSGKNDARVCHAP
jgi:hypothetical protein